MATIKISVTHLVDFILRSGDIKSTFLSSHRAVDGIRAHSRYQKKMKKKLDTFYLSEIPISHTYRYDGDTLILSGRMDGLDVSNGVVIEEIKSTQRSLLDLLEPHEMHMAQVKLYAFMHAHQEGMADIGIRVVYIQLENGEEKIFESHFDFHTLERFFEEVMARYLHFYHEVLDYEHAIKKVLSDMHFPFETYRRGQKMLMRKVYETIQDKSVLYAKAPTGIGKTLGTLYPGLKALAIDQTDKLFYLTAKNVGQQVVMETIRLIMQENGAAVGLKFVVITAKEKSCIHDTFKCHPDVCPYAKGHYDRINDALLAAFTQADTFDQKTIESFAVKFQVCPYELSLDLALYASVVICDYNYAFDPSAMLRRFFVEGSGNYTLLIDEAHNLVDRAREMYSATLEKKQILDIRRLVKSLDGKLYGQLSKLNQTLLDMRKELEQLPKARKVVKEAPETLIFAVRDVLSRIEKIFVLHQTWVHLDELLTFYFEGYTFYKTLEFYGSHYVTYYEKQQHNVYVKLFCLNPKTNMEQILGLVQGVVFFSATLTPMDYFHTLLGGQNWQALDLPSPFNANQLCLLCDATVSTKYADRKASIAPIIRSIHEMIGVKSGHYMVYFPSYQYMQSVLEVYEPYKEETLVIQKQGQNAKAREAFLDAFHDTNEGIKVGFAVMGGMFGEGIDLTGEKLIGVIVVGVGLPMICFERDLIKSYFDAIHHKGFDYAYTYPGMNKVLQSAGRVIRTQNDKGVVLLIDQRFRRPDYQALLPYAWRHIHYMKSGMQDRLVNFWRS